MNIFSKIAEGVRKTKDSMMSKIGALFGAHKQLDDDFFDELEEVLITCDIGVETSLSIVEKLRAAVKSKKLATPDETRAELKNIIEEMLGEDKKIDTSTTPSVILVIGVNGAGKTTTIGKLAAKYKNDGKKVLVAAADTFRAAAIEQLQIWTERAGVDIVKHAEGSDPASVVFDAVTAAKARGTDVLICDTAGRLHNKKNLMDELRKISRIIHEQGEGCSLETLLVLDATTGQNAVNQAKLFSEVADITGIVLTKLDGTAKGGIIISIHNELGIPVKLVGIGEKLDDLQEFNAHDFADEFAEVPLPRVGGQWVVALYAGRSGRGNRADGTEFQAGGDYPAGEVSGVPDVARQGAYRYDDGAFRGTPALRSGWAGGLPGGGDDPAGD